MPVGEGVSGLFPTLIEEMCIRDRIRIESKGKLPSGYVSPLEKGE